MIMETLYFYVAEFEHTSPFISNRWKDFRFVEDNARRMSVNTSIKRVTVYRVINNLFEENPEEVLTFIKGELQP